MLAASVIFNVVHPGRLMPGKESDLPGCGERRKMKKQGVQGKYEFIALTPEENRLVH